MSIIRWFRRKRKEKEDLENIKTTLSELQKTLEELPPPIIVPVRIPTKFDVFLQTVEKIVKK